MTVRNAIANSAFTRMIDETSSRTTTLTNGTPVQLETCAACLTREQIPE